MCFVMWPGRGAQPSRELDPSYSDEDWGFTAQQALEKLLKTWIVLSDRLPPRIHDLADLAEIQQKL